jgi:hypothetical protein
VKTSNNDVFIGLASIPSRRRSLEQVVAKLLPQCGQMGVYLNNWDDIPKFLRNSKITIARSQDHGDVRDNGKYFFLDSSKLRYYASVDDDIEYPFDYIQTMKAHQARVGAGLVGVHGTYYPAEITSLLENRVVAHFREAFDCFLPATLIGTGTTFLDRELVGLRYKEFGTPGMADVWLAVAAKKRGLTLWVVPRAAHWLKPIPQPERRPDELDLYLEGKNDDTVQVQTLKSAGIKGSIPAILESIMRCPSIAASLSIIDADYLWRLTRQVGIERLRKRDRALYTYALSRHKSVNLERKGQLEFMDLAEPYSDWLLELASRDEGGTIRDQWINGYLQSLTSLEQDSLPAWILKDRSKATDYFNWFVGHTKADPSINVTDYTEMA